MTGQGSEWGRRPGSWEPWEINSRTCSETGPLTLRPSPSHSRKRLENKGPFCNTDPGDKGRRRSHRVTQPRHSTCSETETSAPVRSTQRERGELPHLCTLLETAARGSQRDSYGRERHTARVREGRGGQATRHNPRGLQPWAFLSAVVARLSLHQQLPTPPSSLP